MRIAWHGDALRDVVDWVSDTWGVAVCNFLRSTEFRFGNAVEAVQSIDHALSGLIIDRSR